MKPNRRSEHSAKPVYDHVLFPACEGEPVSERHWQDPKLEMQRAFLQAYFRTNLEYAKLLHLAKQPRKAGAQHEEQSIRAAIESSIQAREALEDSHTAKGVVAAPVYRDGFVVDVRFEYPGKSPVPTTVVARTASRVLTFGVLPKPGRRK